MQFLDLLVSVLLAVSTTVASSQQPLNVPASSAPFNPRLYPKNVAHCPAINRARDGQTPSNIDIHYVETNPTAKRTLVLIHGWPSLWSTWSNQITHFSNEYHLIVPDLRGFGASTHPGDVQTSGTMADMVSDVACILQHANVEEAVCVGHDWGAQICWEAARMRPDLISAVSGAVVPYISAAGPFAPAEHLAALLPRLAYQVYFEKRTRQAAVELNTSIRRTLRAVFRSVGSPPPAEFLTSPTSLLEAWNDYKEIPPIPFLTQDEEDYLVEQYSLQGFENTLQFYTFGNRLATWQFDRTQGNFSIPQPALFIAPTSDPVADWQFASTVLKSPSFFSHLSTEAMDTAHWPQLEKPEEFNRILQDWLEKISPA